MSQLKQLFKVKKTRSAFYTGGEVEWTKDGDMMFFQCGAKVEVFDINQGQVVSSIGEEVEQKGFDGDDVDEDEILTFTLSSDNSTLICSHKSRLFKMWDLRENKLVKMWQSMHKVPVSKLAMSSDGFILATGATDASIRLWNLKHHACTHNIPTAGMHGVVSVLLFHETEDARLLFGAADDAVIKAWNAETGNVHLEFKGHYSKITSLNICEDNKHMISCGRDKVFIVWNIITGKSKLAVPVYESWETMLVLPDAVKLPGINEPYEGTKCLVGAGENGLIRVWDAEKPTLLYAETKSEESYKTKVPTYIMKLMYNSARKRLAVINSDHTVLLLDTENDLALDKQFVGFNDEVLDIVFLGEKESHIAVATNSPIIKVYTRSTWSCQSLKGHTDLVISLTITKADTSLLVSGAKDNSIRIWRLDSNGILHCVASGSYHTASVTTIAFGSSNNLLVSASIDTTIKVWKMPKKLKFGDIEKLNVQHTVIGHDKDINSVCISPNDKIIATGSLDRTAKLWSATDLSLIGVLRGHRKGIWCVKFSPVDQVLLTTSADATLKLWSLSDLSCLKTLEGHDSSVLCAEFLTRGLQIISGGGDGLLKIWCIKTSTCMATLGEHDGKIWALAVSHDEMEVITGGDDSKLIVWEDVTEETNIETINKRQELILQNQELSNLIHNEELLSALKLALSLNRPATVLKIIETVQLNKEAGLEEVINALDVVHKETLLSCANIWNANSRTAEAAQIVISLLLSDISNGTVHVDKSVMESLLVYSERHFKRMSQLQQDLNVLLYTCDIMQPRTSS